MGLSKLDLKESTWPFCLLEYSRAVNKLETGDELEVIVEDPDVYSQICMLLHNTRKHSYTTRLENRCYHILIKGAE